MNEEARKLQALISRSLDGALREDEQLRLDRELIRNPEARRLREVYQRIDAAATDALGEAVAERDFAAAGTNPTDWIQEVAQHRTVRRRRWWWLVPGAAAAALLAVVANQLTLPRPSDVNIADTMFDHASLPAPSLPAVFPVRGAGEPEMHRVSAAPKRRIQRKTDRSVYGIMGDDGRLYLIEVDRTRTIKRRRLESTSPLLGGHEM